VHVRKCYLEVEFFHKFLKAYLGRKKNNIFHKKFEFSDKRRIKYEFLTRLKLKTSKHRPRNQILSSFFPSNTSKNIYKGSEKFHTISTKPQFILIFRPKRTKSQLILCHLHLNVVGSTVANYSRKDQTVINYC